MIKKLFLTLALILFPTIASAQCNGVFTNNTLCGNISGGPQVPGQVPATSVITAVSAGIDTNVLATGAIITSAPTVDSTFCGHDAALGGNSFYSFTVGAASGFTANCILIVTNNDGWTSGRGKNIVVNGLTTQILWPGQTFRFRSISNAWVQDPVYQRVLVPLGQKFYADIVNGNSANDCLAPGTNNACQNIGDIYTTKAYQYFSIAPSSSTPNTPGLDIRLATNPSCVPSTGVGCYQGAHLSGAIPGNEGHNAIMIECDGGSATNCTVSDNSGNCAIGLFNAGINIELKNITLASPTNCAIEASDHSTARIESGVVLGQVGTNINQLQADTGGQIILDGGNTLTISGGGGFLAFSGGSSQIILDQGTISFSTNVTYTQQVLACQQLGVISANSTTWTLNAHTITGTRFSATTGCAILLGTNTPNTTIPGSALGILSSGAIIDNLIGSADSNALNAITGNYPITPGDCGKTIQASGGFFTITLPGVGGFLQTCQITVANADTGRGKALSGFPTNITSPNILWPSQVLTLKIIGGAWTATNPGRWVKQNAQFFVDTAGSDSNDGLATGAGAFRHLDVCRMSAQFYIDTQSGGNGGVTCLVTPTQAFQEFIQVFFSLTGGGSLIFQGNGGAFIWRPINSGYALQFGDEGVVGLTNVTFDTTGVTTPAGYVLGHNLGVIDVNTGITVDTGGISGSAFDCDFDSHFNINNGLTIVNTIGAIGGSFYKVCQNSTWNINGTHTFTTNPGPGTWTTVKTTGTITFNGNVTFSGANTAGASSVTGNGVLNNLTGGALPGGVPTTATGGQVCTTLC